MATSSSGDTRASSPLSFRSSDSEASSSSIVSLLDRLKSPMPADISRKRQTKTNPPPIGKRQCRGNTASDPRSVEPSKRVQEFPNELLKVSGGKLFCTGCREELGLKRSTIQNHIRS